MVHKFQCLGQYLALDVYSGAVHKLDELAYRLLDFTDEAMPPVCPAQAIRALADYDAGEVSRCYEALYALRRKGLLHAPDTYAQLAEQMGPAPVKSMCLNVAHDCNLRCEYCFAAKGNFGGESCLMPFEIARSAIDFLIEHAGVRKNLEVDFFGGEPLMNFDVVKQTVAYARSRQAQTGKRFRFTLTTNGLLLDSEKIDYLNREMYNLVLSLDGRKETNDRLRVTAGGRGSYDAIVPNYQSLVKARGDGQYYVRGTFTKHNLDFTDDVLHFLDLGFAHVSVEPVVSAPSLPFSIQNEDLPAVFGAYERLARAVVEKKRAGEDFQFFHFMLDLDGGPCAIKRLRGCSCGNEYVAVTPQGDIYPCHQFVGKTQWKMGNVRDKTFDLDIKERFSHINVYRKPACMDCWAKFFCSGGCTANNLEYAGDVFTPHALACALERKRLECAIAIQAALAE